MLEFLKIILDNCIKICILGVVTGFVFAYIPESFLIYMQKFFEIKKFENNGRFYERFFKITKWKDHVPQFSNIAKTAFKMASVDIKSEKYLEKFKIETIRAEFTHIFLIVFSPYFYIINENKKIGLAVSVLYAVGNLPFIAIQRYNRPRIEKILKIKSEYTRENQRI